MKLPLRHERAARVHLEQCMDAVKATPSERKIARRLFQEILDHENRPPYDALVKRVMRDLRVGREGAEHDDEAPVATPPSQA